MTVKGEKEQSRPGDTPVALCVGVLFFVERYVGTCAVRC